MTAGDLIPPPPRTPPRKEVVMQGAEKSPTKYDLTDTPQGIHSVACPGLPGICCRPRRRKAPGVPASEPASQFLLSH